jgi:sugar phosphate isomerase/epimerase
MRHGISTHLFLPQRLTAAMLDTMRTAGAQAIEVFAARHHFDYTDRGAVRELANWFRSSEVTPTLHMPLFTAEDEAIWTRHTAPTINLISEQKPVRIASMDEVKRALEAAEQVPFESCVLHLGLKDDEWSTRSIDDSLTAIEHLKAFAGPLGVKLLLENLTNDVTTPAHLAEIVRVGHFQSVGYCLDLGHAHLSELGDEAREAGAKSVIEAAFEAFGDKLAELHVHDNHGPFGGTNDEHLWPGGGTIDFEMVDAQIAKMKTKPLGMLEIAYDLGHDLSETSRRASRAFEIMATL